MLALLSGISLGDDVHDLAAGRIDENFKACLTTTLKRTNKLPNERDSR
jgi:hypothetical protein